MAGCVLRISDYSGSLPACLEVVGETDRNAVVEVSDESEDFRAQINHAVRFLVANNDTLNAFKVENKNISWGLDFGVWLSDAYAQSYHFPSELVRIAGELNISLEVSIYAASDS